MIKRFRYEPNATATKGQTLHSNTTDLTYEIIGVDGNVISKGKMIILCDVCVHDEHEAGKCRQCNCGESEVVGHTAGSQTWHLAPVTDAEGKTTLRQSGMYRRGVDFNYD